MGAPKSYTHFSELCRDPELDVVCVLTPTGTHLEVARAASAAGKHVLIEKPLDVNLERADEMIRLCRANRTKLGVIFQMRFGTVAARLKEAVQSGASAASSSPTRWTSRVAPPPTTTPRNGAAPRPSKAGAAS